MKLIFVILLSLSFRSYADYGFENCGMYELEGTLRKEKNEWFFVYREKTTTEIRFKVKEYRFGSFESFIDGLNIKANFNLLATCKNACDVKLMKMWTIEPWRLPANDTSKAHKPKKKMPCQYKMKEGRKKPLR